MEKTALAKRHDMDQKEQLKLHQTARLEAHIQRHDIFFDVTGPSVVCKVIANVSNFVYPQILSTSANISTLIKTTRE